MDFITDLSSQCISYITVYQQVCREYTPDGDATDSASFAIFIAKANSISVDAIIGSEEGTEFFANLKKRVGEIVWSSKEEPVTNATLACFFGHCKQLLYWVDGCQKRHKNIKPGNLYSSPYEWRACIRAILYAEKEQRLALVKLLQYMPIQVILSLGGNKFDFAEQRLLQIWEPDDELNNLGKSREYHRNWWAANWEWKSPGDTPPEERVADTGTRLELAPILLMDNRKVLKALKIEENAVPFETLFVDELDEIENSRKIRWQEGLAGKVEQWEQGIQNNLDSAARKEQGIKENIQQVSAAILAKIEKVLKPSGDADTVKDQDTGDPQARAKSLNLYALAFSGGGIRSATFNLGVLQKLAELGVLSRFDYLSTVSGGGYIGSWLASWIQRGGSMPKTMDRLNPKKSVNPLSDEVRPIRWLRMFSNYLAPNAGIMSADSWTMGVTWLRNTVINQVILLLLLCSVLSLIRSIFSSWLLIPSASTVDEPVIFAGSCLVLLPGALLAGWAMHAYNPEHPPKSLNLEKSRSYYYLLMIWGVVSTFVLSSWMYSHASHTYSFAQKVDELKVAGYVGFVALMLVAVIGAYHKCAQSNKKWYEIYAFIIVSSALAALCGLLLLSLSWELLEKVRAIVSVKHFTAKKLAFIVGVPMVLEAISITVVVRMAIMGVLFPDLRREWWGRMGALVHRFIFLWLLIAFSALILPEYLTGLKVNAISFPAIFGGWSAIIGYAVKLAFGPKVTGDKPANGSVSPAEIFVKLAPYLFAIGFLLLGSITLRYLEHFLKIKFFDLTVDPGFRLLQNFSIGAVLAIVTFALSWRVGVNEFSLHHFYRNRLTRAYLGATRRREDRDKTANNFTGFDVKDDLLLTNLLSKNKYSGPYPIINVTLNSSVVSNGNLDRQDRKAESFVFTPKFCGFDFCRTRPSANSDDNPYEYGYRPTGKYAYPEGPHLGTAMTISGAAVSPNMGYHSSPAIAFLLTIFNVRLGWWMGNPRRKSWKRADPRLGIFYLINDLVGSSDVNSNYVCLSDGGHFDNMGLYELVRRRCSHIVLCDAEEDRNSTCEGLASAMRRCRIDFGVEINLDVEPITKKDKETRYCKQHLVKGTIWYPGDAEPSGTMIYIKTSLTGDESVDIREYFMNNPEFPQQSTADQFFDESQFESYRKLGYSSL